jgi:hypothetical protein
MDRLRENKAHSLDVHENIIWISKQLEEIKKLFEIFETHLPKAHKRKFFRFFILLLSISVIVYFISLLFQDEAVRGFLQGLVIEAVGAAILFVLFDLYWREEQKMFGFFARGVQLYSKVYHDGNKLLEFLKELDEQDALEPDMEKHKRGAEKIEKWRKDAIELLDWDWK